MRKMTETEIAAIGLPALPERFSWSVNYEVDSDVDMSWLGKFVKHQPARGWYIDRIKKLLINADSEFDEEQEQYVETYPVKHISRYFSMGQNWQFFVPSDNHNPPGQAWEHVSEEDKAKVIAQWGSIERLDIDCMLEDHKYMEELAEGSRNLWFYDLALCYRGHEITSESCGGIDDDLDHIKSSLREFAAECIAQLLDDKILLLMKRAILTGLLKETHDSEYLRLIAGMHIVKAEEELGDFTQFFEQFGAEKDVENDRSQKHSSQDSAGEFSVED